MMGMKVLKRLTPADYPGPRYHSRCTSCDDLKIVSASTVAYLEGYWRSHVLEHNHRVTIWIEEKENHGDQG